MTAEEFSDWHGGASPLAQPEPFPQAMELDHFLAAVPPEPDWLIPGLFERGDRMILIGNEGKGKSTLLRQIGIQSASGIHPFGGDPYEPLRVLIYDLENSKRHIHERLDRMRNLAGHRYQGGLYVVPRGEALDLTAGDGRLLQAEMDHVRPDLLIIGPIYKLVAGEPNEEGAARLVTSWLDKFRIAFGCAILLEAHMPHPTNGGARPKRPYGASLWMRWPEFGLHLADDGTLSHWRGARDERQWPTALKRGGDWPWTATVATDPQVELMAAIHAAVEASGAMSGKDIEEAVRGKATSIRAARAQLIRDGYLTRDMPFKVIRPFRPEAVNP